MPRSQKDIIHHSVAIRDQLIDEGVYDLDRLPHVNYSAILGKKLSKLREQKRLEDSGYKKGDNG